MLKFLLWLVLLVIAWPLALAALVLYPVVWVLALPFRLIGVSVGAILAGLSALLRLPGRVIAGPRGR